MPVDDPRAVEVVRGELAANAIAGEDADPEAPHLARNMPEHDVLVVELHAEHRVGQGLDHLALEFNLVLLRHAASNLGRHPGASAWPLSLSGPPKLPVRGPRSVGEPVYPGDAPPVRRNVFVPPDAGFSAPPCSFAGGT